MSFEVELQDIGAISGSLPVRSIELGGQTDLLQDASGDIQANQNYSVTFSCPFSNWWKVVAAEILIDSSTSGGNPFVFVQIQHPQPFDLNIGRDTVPGNQATRLVTGSEADNIVQSDSLRLLQEIVLPETWALGFNYQGGGSSSDTVSLNTNLLVTGG